MNDPISDAVSDAAKARKMAWDKLQYIKRQTNDPNTIAKATQDVKDADQKQMAAGAAARSARKKAAASGGQ